MKRKITTEGKPIHAKPSLYAHYFYLMKEEAMKFGYNLVLHGSMNRDLDLIAIPWRNKLKPHRKMIDSFCKILDGTILVHGKDQFYGKLPGGRLAYVINILRHIQDGESVRDMQYYLDISVVAPTDQK